MQERRTRKCALQPSVELVERPLSALMKGVEDHERLVAELVTGRMREREPFADEPPTGVEQLAERGRALLDPGREHLAPGVLGARGERAFTAQRQHGVAEARDSDAGAVELLLHEDLFSGARRDQTALGELARSGAVGRASARAGQVRDLEVSLPTERAFKLDHGSLHASSLPR